MTRPVDRASLVVELNGGLANQLFQWATFTTVWNPDRGPIVWDERLVRRPAGPGNQLVRLGLVDPGDVLGYGPLGRGWWSLVGLLPTRVRSYLTSELASRTPFQPRMPVGEVDLARLRQDGRWWARGYFQNPAVFESRREELGARLRRALDHVSAHRPPLSGRDYAAAHVRRGDYVAVARNTERLGVCTVDYFVSAVSGLQVDLDLKIVSDDPQWCREVLVPALGPRAEVVETRSDTSDLLLLTGATELVLSNSTFSWWGAFAGRASLIVAPTPWYDVADAGGAALPTLAHVVRDKESGALVGRIR